MKSPFPGMDPYLERYGGDVHTSLATYAKDYLQRQLPTDLIACVEEHVVVVSDDDEQQAYAYCPDTPIEVFLNVAASQSESAAGMAVADSIEVPRIAEPMTEHSIRIVEPRSGNRIVTAIELLTPANKIGEAGRNAYSKKRAKLLEGGVSLVEIDLVREGRPNLAVAMKSIPARYRQPYRICVVRAWRMDKAQIYRVSLRNRLPVVSIPLRRSESEVSVDLQMLIEMVYENGRYYLRDYSEDLVPPLSAADADWANRLLRETGLRK
jgi:Protein of unknown function (DUF4058)